MKERAFKVELLDLNAGKDKDTVKSGASKSKKKVCICFCNLANSVTYGTDF